HCLALQRKCYVISQFFQIKSTERICMKHVIPDSGRLHAWRRWRMLLVVDEAPRQLVGQDVPPLHPPTLVLQAVHPVTEGISLGTAAKADTTWTPESTERLVKLGKRPSGDWEQLETNIVFLGKHT
ncbi:hypothetical protein XENOCAPTIV_009564, partial [Xenoophorus captivus]